MPTATTTPMPIKVLASARTIDVALDDLPPPLEDPDEPEAPAGRVGTEVVETLARHEVAAALAAPAVDGTLLLTVPFPPKLHA